MNALTQQEARTSIVIVEHTFSLMNILSEYYLILVPRILLFSQHFIKIRQET